MMEKPDTLVPEALRLAALARPDSTENRSPPERGRLARGPLSISLLLLDDSVLYP